ncbi:MAG TPA: lipopolysaccharide heptosyltransferase II [Myxococcota bacterium]|nr:lipopolysaccharide heptosyltransferase II [Myxococcota bacterium]HRY97366.1 lipopolysaccharide heptosyltransferase II [Myxococcota bacterium]
MSQAEQSTGERPPNPGVPSPVGFERAVVVQTAFVGDVVFASPVVAALKAARPGSHLAMLVRPDKAEVAACIPGVDEVLTWDKHGSDGGTLGIVRVARRLRQAGFDLLISPHRSLRSALLARFSGIPVRVGHRGGLRSACYTHGRRPDPGEPNPLLQDLALLEAVGIQPAGTRLRLRTPGGQSQYLQDFYRRHNLPEDARLAALCIGSVWPTKRWPPVYFASLAESLRARGWHPILFGSQDELPLARRIEENAREGLLSCVGNTLAESAALLERARLAVGGDTGLMHMARALGTACVLIYGPTDARMHSFGDETRVLVARVKCRPCSRHGHLECPEGHHDCMRLVSPEQVMDEVRTLVGVQTPPPGGLTPTPRALRAAAEPHDGSERGAP